MRAALAVLFLAACGSPHEAASDAANPPIVDASHSADAAHVPHPDAAPVVDAMLGPDAYVAACDTVTSDHTVHAGDAVTTCLSSDQDVDTYRFTAPNDAAGGILRMKLDFNDCQISFALWLDNDNSYPNIQSDDSFDTMYVGQLDHNLVQVTYPGLGYHLVVKKRRPFTGTCTYTLSTTYAPINDPYEPNQDAAHAKTLAIGTTATAYFACVAPDRDPNIFDDCDDLYSIDLPPGQYQMSYALPSASYGINPGLSMGCFDSSDVETFNYFVFQPAGGGSHNFGSLFTIARQSHCYVRMTGSSQGFISTGYADAAPPSTPAGADYPYTFLIAVKPPM
jgi:hypothetical protein